jgi:acylphosphatase
MDRSTDGGSSQRVRAKLEVFGKVQGVFYRDTLRRAALEHGVSGSAINREDLSVEAVLEGDREDVAAVIEIARKGPPGALVKQLDITWENPEGVTGFVTGGPSLTA